MMDSVTGPKMSAYIEIADPSGFHVRGAALVSIWLSEAGIEAEVTLDFRGRRVSGSPAPDALSLITRLGAARQGDTILVETSGPDADYALLIVRRVLEATTDLPAVREGLLNSHPTIVALQRRYAQMAVDKEARAQVIRDMRQEAFEEARKEARKEAFRKARERYRR